MKKLLSVALVLLLIPAAALAEVDLSSLSFSELAALRDRAQMLMMQSDSWQEVTVPQGTWEVGVQIPAGTWTIRCADIGRNEYILKKCSIRWGVGKPDDSGYWEYKYDKGKVEIYNPNNVDYADGQVTEYIITLEEGDFIYISPTYNKVVFTPYSGMPSFGFK